jgi:hypothetical protein
MLSDSGNRPLTPVECDLERDFSMCQPYQMADSGNFYKLGSLLYQLDIPYHRRPGNILRGGSRTGDFPAVTARLTRVASQPAHADVNA